MLNHPTLEKLEELRLSGMAKALREQLESPEAERLAFEERLGLMIDREATEREARRLTTRLKKAKLRQSASIEDLDYRKRPRAREAADAAALLLRLGPAPP